MNVPEEKQEEWLQTIGNFTNDEQVAFYAYQYLEACCDSPDQDERNGLINYIDTRLDDSDEFLSNIVGVIDFMTRDEEH